jgi:hypothetical protein
MIRSGRSWAVGVLLAAAAVIGTVVAQDFGETIIKRGAVDGDLYLAGRTVEVAARVEGDLVAAGQRVSVTRPVAEDVIAAGEVVTLTGPVADDVRAAGRLVTLAGDVGDHIAVAGETVTLSSGAATGGYAWLAGRLVQVLGDVGGELKAAGQEVVVGGTVAKDATLMARRIRILETAHIHGRLAYRSPDEPEIADGAVIDGDIHRMPMPDAEKAAPRIAGAAVATGIVFGLGLFVVGAAYLAAFPAVAADAAGKASRQPWTALGLGLAVLLGVPFAAMVLAITVVGLLLAFAILAVYAVLLLAGYVNAVAWLARVALRRWRGLEVPGRGALLALVALLVVQLVPVLGQLIVLFVWLAGIGGLMMALEARYRGKAAPGPS